MSSARRSRRAGQARSRQLDAVALSRSAAGGRSRRPNPRTWALLAAASLVTTLATPRPASALYGDRYGAFGVDGSLRTVTGGTRNYDHPLLYGLDNPADAFSQTLLRLEAGGRPNEWLSYELHGVADLTFGTFSSALGGGSGALPLPGTGGSAMRFRAVDEAQELLDDDDTAVHGWLDRCAIKIALPRADLTVGRQPLSFGKAYFWNPLDVFGAFDPRQFDRDYKPGVDALRLDVPLGDFSGLTVVAAAGRRLDLATGGWPEGEDGWVDASLYGSGAIARVFTNHWEWDWALQAGAVYGGWQVGGAASGELDTLSVRLEGAYLLARDARPVPFAPGEDEVVSHATAVLGLGHRFENELMLEGEYLYNGAGDPDQPLVSMLRQSTGGTWHISRHLAGVSASYPLLPILNVSLATMAAISDNPSALIQPGLQLSVSDEADFMAGAMLPIGERPAADSLEFPSEFGTYPYIGYMEFKFYF